MRYANLHSHTDYSNTRLIDSIIKIPTLIDTSIHWDYVQSLAPIMNF